MDRVIFCVFSPGDEEVYHEIVPKFFPQSDEVVHTTVGEDGSELIIARTHSNLSPGKL